MSKMVTIWRSGTFSLYDLRYSIDFPHTCTHKWILTHFAGLRKCALWVRSASPPPPSRISHYHMSSCSQTACVCTCVWVWACERKRESEMPMFLYTRVLVWTHLFVCVHLCLGPMHLSPSYYSEAKLRLSGSDCLLCSANVIAEISIVIHLA